MWFKFMINVGVNQASAAMNAPYSVFKRDADARMLMDALMHEVIALSEPAGVNLGVDDLHRWHAVLAGLADDGETSMLQDVRAGRNTEVEIFAGKVLTLAQQYGIDTPYNRAMLSTLRVLTRTT
jgi:2-dehydropantoate 2-reductase